MAIPVVVGALGTIPKGLEKTERIENYRKNRNHPGQRSVKIG